MSNGIMSKAQTEGGALLFLTVLMAGCQEDIYAMSQSHQVTYGEDGPSGFSCGNIFDGGSSLSGGEVGEDFWIREDVEDGRVRVRIGSGDDTLITRNYGEEFLSTGKLDRFVVKTKSGEEHSFMYWGGTSCEECPAESFDQLPGDPWGCGVPFKPAADAEASVAVDSAHEP